MGALEQQEVRKMAIMKMFLVRRAATLAAVLAWGFGFYALVRLGLTFRDVVASMPIR